MANINLYGQCKKTSQKPHFTRKKQFDFFASMRI